MEYENKLIEGSSEKVNRRNFENKNDKKLIASCFCLSAVVKNTFLFIKKFLL
jgi:hypothetical protein